MGGWMLLLAFFDCKGILPDYKIFPRQRYKFLILACARSIMRTLLYVLFNSPENLKIPLCVKCTHCEGLKIISFETISMSVDVKIWSTK